MGEKKEMNWKNNGVHVEFLYSGVKTCYYKLLTAVNRSQAFCFSVRYINKVHRGKRVMLPTGMLLTHILPTCLLI